jgi:hypothetical protein
MNKKSIKNSEMQGEHVSLSDYWYFKNNNETKNNLNIFRPIIKLIKIFFETFFKISIVRSDTINKNNYSDFEKTSLITQKEIIKCRDNLLAEKFSVFFKKLQIKTSKDYLKTIIKKHDEFFFKKNFIKDNYGGISYNNSLSLFVFSSIVKPDCVIESGVWKGFTTSIFDKTVSNKNKFCFDINFSKLLYKSKNAEYVNYDIQDYNFKSKNFFSNCLAFFDDHVSQYDRFIFCKERKIPFIVFDDDNDYFTIHRDGWPSIPTISMIQNSYKINPNFTWKSLNRLGVAKFKKINPSILNDYYYCKAPNLFSLTGYQSNSPMSFLVRKTKKKTN